MKKQLEEIKLKIKNDKYNNLRDAYEALGNIVESQPELAKDVFSTFNEGLKSDKNDKHSLESAYNTLWTTLDSIFDAKPKLAKDVLNAINEGLKSDKNDEYRSFTLYTKMDHRLKCDS